MLQCVHDPTRKPDCRGRYGDVAHKYSTPAADAQSLADVLRAPDVCSVPLSVLRQRLDAARTPEQRQAADDEASNWGCYDPAPGHPTLQEKGDYIARISQYSKAAEEKYGIPAAAIAAMATVEAGYGYTRTAKDAHNLSGWKAAKDGSEPHYVLACQDTTGEFGPKDENRCYAIFTTEEAAVEHVTSRLASGFNTNYAKANERYREEMAGGVSIIERTQNWTAGIANPYNWQPVTYGRTICRLMRDPIGGSDEINPDTNLYGLSAATGEIVALTALPVARRSCDAVTVPPT